MHSVYSKGQISVYKETFFLTVHMTSNTVNSNLKWKSIMCLNFREMWEEQFSFTQITTTTITITVRDLDTNKATVLDAIPAKLLRQCNRRNHSLTLISSSLWIFIKENYTNLFTTILSQALNTAQLLQTDFNDSKNLDSSWWIKATGRRAYAYWNFYQRLLSTHRITEQPK